MAKITRKLKTQARYCDVARGPIAAFEAGHIAGLSLPEGARGVSFAVSGHGKEAKHQFFVGLTEAEWQELKTTLDAMLHGQKT
jgi:hypothetical protein